MCVDPKGRLIVSDQYGELYRVTPPPLGGNAGDTKVEQIAAEIGEAQGLLWAFDCLYVVVNDGQASTTAASTASRDTNGDDTLDKVELLRKHRRRRRRARPARRRCSRPDGKSLYVVCGNQTKLTEL